MFILIIYLIGCLCAFFIAKYDFKRQNYTYIKWEDERHTGIACSFFSWIGVLILLILLTYPPYNKNI